MQTGMPKPGRLPFGKQKAGQVLLATQNKCYPFIQVTRTLRAVCLEIFAKGLGGLKYWSR